MALTGEEIEDIAQRVYEKLRDDTFRLPAAAGKYLAPFAGYMPAPVQVGYGPDYCMLLAYIQNNGALMMQLKAPDGTLLWQQVLNP